MYKPIKLQCQTILCTSHNGNGILTSEHALVYIAQMIKFVLLSRWSICMPSLQMDALYQPQAPSPLFCELLGCCSLSTFTYTFLSSWWTFGIYMSPWFIFLLCDFYGFIVILTTMGCCFMDVSTRKHLLSIHNRYAISMPSFFFLTMYICLLNFKGCNVQVLK